MIDPDTVTIEIADFLGTAMFRAKVVPGICPMSSFYSFKTGLSCARKVFLWKEDFRYWNKNLPHELIFEAVGDSVHDTPMYIKVSARDIVDRVKLPLRIRACRAVRRFLTGRF